MPLMVDWTERIPWWFPGGNIVESLHNTFQVSFIIKNVIATLVVDHTEGFPRKGNPSNREILGDAKSLGSHQKPIAKAQTP